MVDLPQRPAPPRSPFDTVRRLARRALERISWFGLGRAVAVSLCVLAVGAGAFWLLRAPAPPVEASLPFATSTTAVASAGSSDPAAGPTPSPAAGTVGDGAATPTTSVSPASEPSIEIVVHVAGAVAAPGVYRLPTGSRAIDAVLAAGGATPDADPDAVNLAQLLRDGDRIVLPSIADAVVPVPGITNAGASGAGSGGTSSASGEGSAVPIDLNRADAEGLDAPPGIGPATAGAIVAYRDEHAPFASVDDLAEVRGIGPAKLEAIRGLVTV